ncbi:phosphatase PAP2 family protein [Chryseolinea lacunae]|uniref:Phosphatase PAP2 family protein n=1 Tax=Chryseolinea lacunae TaxID=2801331 RepID=A0ABS1L165_9BACT|nr:phosphatase PAP2 family protein [Chryseolinea lacunae]MBL0745257.1 phosphatase PAP2 family protein [Chryseolinea lacunae]
MKLHLRTPLRYQGIFALLFILFSQHASLAQSYDSLLYSADSSKTYKATVVPYKDQLMIYKTPKPFSFIWQVPKTIGWSAKDAFRKKALPAWGIIAATTLIFIPLDHHMQRGVQNFCDYTSISPDTEYKTLIGFKLGSKDVPVYQLPQNVNTAFYSIGEGFTSVAISGGLWVYGKIKRDRRSVSTASQILQVQFTVGVLTQAIKRITGRESPFMATSPTGVWRPLPGFKEFTNNTPKYDAFPSGHIATMMATVTVLADNYPEKRWIRPVGYTLMTLVGAAMVNNGVHWVSDYPLAIGIGYVCAKATVKMNRLVQYRPERRR